MGGRVYTSKYLDNDLISQARERLVPFLYERLLAYLRRLQGEILRQDLDGKAATLDHASAIVAELMTTVDREDAEAGVPCLDGLYCYLGHEIYEVGRSMDQIRLTKLIGMVACLHESWVIATRTRWPEETRLELALTPVKSAD